MTRLWRGVSRGAGADVTLLDFAADEVTAVMARPVLAAGAGADVTLLDFDADEVTTVMARPGRAALGGAGAGAGVGATLLGFAVLADLDGVIVLDVSDADVMILDAV